MESYLKQQYFSYLTQEYLFIDITICWPNPIMFPYATAFSFFPGYLNTSSAFRESQND